MDFYHGIIPCYYVVVKDIINTAFGPTKSLKIREALVAIVTLSFLGLVFILMIPFFLAYAIVHLSLRLKHGKGFGGILSCTDSVFEKFNPKLTMNAIFILSHDGTLEELFNDIKGACTRLHHSNYRFSSIVQRFLGYRYFLKNQIHIDDVVVPVRFNDSEYLSREDLYLYLEQHQYYVKSDDKRLWEAKICLQPIFWNNESRVKKHYAVILRHNHTLADAFSIMTYYKKYLCGETMEQPLMKKIDRAKINAALADSSVSAHIHKVIFGDLTDYYLKPPHEGSSHHSVFFNETQPKYLPIMRRLKKNFNTTITDIVAAGATESISKYFQKESINQENMFCAMTCRSAKENIADIFSGKVFGNENAGILMSLPVATRTSALEKLKEVAVTCKKVRCSVDRQCEYICSKLADFLPADLQDYLFDHLRITLAMTNVPLPDFGKIGNCPVVDLFGYVNHFNKIKFILGVLSHKGCMRLSLTAMKGMVKTRDDLQDVMDGILQYIDKLNEECGA